MTCPQQSEEGMSTFESEVTDGCEPLQSQCGVSGLSVSLLSLELSPFLNTYSLFLDEDFA